ncbi:hypothetical protein F8M41_003476 [Gigaspora margarita]|uniref:Uncharacterized protein n=1 Tax=Gigaspora margarita TaxID=4874 RepID=A0A8H3XCS8_GIGMA|nr:hypothetical protein F8M41_003476 [Gigaspora margarita]
MFLCSVIKSNEVKTEDNNNFQKENEQLIQDNSNLIQQIQQLRTRIQTLLQDITNSSETIKTANNLAEQILDNLDIDYNNILLTEKMMQILLTSKEISEIK